MLGLVLSLGPRLKFNVFQQNTIMYPVGVRLETCYIMNTPDLLEHQQVASYGCERYGRAQSTLIGATNIQYKGVWPCQLIPAQPSWLAVSNMSTCAKTYTLLKSSLNHIYIVTEKEILSILIWRLVPLLLYRYYIEDEEEPCMHRLEIEPAIYHVTIMSACCIQW